MALLRRRFWWILPAVVVVLLLAGGVAAGVLYTSLTTPVDPEGETRIITIEPGSGTAQIGMELERAGLIKNRQVFALLARYLKKDGKLQAGEYELSPAMPMRAIIDKLERGEVVTYTFTVPEGYTVRQIVDRLVAEGFGEREEFESLVQDRSLVAEWLPAGLVTDEPLEGYLFPETYTVTARTTEREIIEAMVAETRRVWTEERLARAAGLGLTVHQVLTLASIIEEEAQVAEERPLIAAVYHNRLRLGMLLQADPTVLYALGRPAGEPLLTRDLDVDSPYNTYRYPGLPPGPIANPGLAAIDAALYPADVDYLYFVARNDGTHAFARNYKEHQENVARYQN